MNYYHVGMMKCLLLMCDYRHSDYLFNTKTVNQINLLCRLVFTGDISFSLIFFHFFDGELHNFVFAA